LQRRRASRPRRARERARPSLPQRLAKPDRQGFAVGRTIFSEAAQSWFAGRIGDNEAVDDMAGRFERLAAAWTGANGLKQAT
jgi:5-dehydro-2-deoxygluconokinase